MFRSTDSQRDVEAGVDADGAEAVSLLPLPPVENAPDETSAPRRGSAPQDDSEEDVSSRPESPTSNIDWLFTDEWQAGPSRPHPRPYCHNCADDYTINEWLLAEEPQPGPSSTPDAQVYCHSCGADYYDVNQALWKAVKEKDVTAVKDLLHAYAQLAAQLPACSLLHWCVQNYEFHQQEMISIVEMEILTSILDTTGGPDVLECLEHTEKGGIYTTLLRRAINRGQLDVVKVLLERGARVTRVSKCNETVLHRSAKHPHILKYFLDNYEIENSVDEDGLAPIHWAAAYDEVESMKLLLNRFGEGQLAWQTTPNEQCKTPWHMIVGNDSLKVAEFLVQSKRFEGLTVKSKYGETPFYSSACAGYNSLTGMLLQTGEHYLAEKDNDGKSVIEQIVKNVNEPLKLLENTFKEFINLSEDRVICVDFYFLADYDDTSVGQIDVIKDMVKWGLSKILVHPLVESLLYLRWKTFLPVFYAMLVIYFTFLISFNVFLVNVFNKNDVNFTTFCSESNSTVQSCLDCYDDWTAWVLIVLIYLSICLMLAQECIYIFLRQLHYFGHVESWMKLCVCGLGLAVPLLVRCVSPDSSSWPRHVACAALLLAWLQAMLLLSRFPGWGYYVLMLEKVLINVLKVFATAVCLVIGFALCFMIQYHAKPPFDGPASAFVKTLVMMSSEFDYEDLFGEDHDELNDTKLIVLCLFVVFVIFIAVVLMNLMIGVAVSDINELNLIGNIRRLEKQVEFLCNLEVVGDTVLGKWWKRLSRVRYHYCITNNLEFNKKWEVVFMSREDIENDSQALPLELKEGLMNVLRKKLESKKEEKVEQEKNDKLNALFDAVVRPSKNENKADKSDEKVNETPWLNEKIKSLVDEISNVKKTNEHLNQKIDDLNELMKDVSLKLAALR